MIPFLFVVPTRLYLLLEMLTSLQRLLLLDLNFVISNQNRRRTCRSTVNQLQMPRTTGSVPEASSSIPARTTFHHACSFLQQGGYPCPTTFRMNKVFGHGTHQCRAHVRMIPNELFHPERNRHRLVPKSHLQVGHARCRKARFGIDTRQAGCIEMACLHNSVLYSPEDEWNKE
jgi:hypothetical protein